MVESPEKTQQENSQSTKRGFVKQVSTTKHGKINLFQMSGFKW
jgi:hypothetical protein